MTFQPHKNKDNHSESYNNAGLCEREIELSRMSGNIYDTLEARNRDLHVYNDADKDVAIPKSGTCRNNTGHNTGKATSVALSSLKVELTCWAICLAAIGILLFCTLICAIAGVIVYHVTSAKTVEDGRQIQQAQDTPRQNTTDALAMEIKSMNAEFTRVYEAWKVQMSLFSDNHSDTRDYINDMNRRIETVDSVIQVVKEAVKAVQDTVHTLQDNENISSDHGSTYVRWGRTSCGGGNGTQLIYKGYVAGSHFQQSGNGANQLCLPDAPTWGKYDDVPHKYTSYIYGTEYEANPPVFNKPVDDQDVPCAVCLTVGVTVMIPARTACYPGWNVEYTGYLMSNHHSYTRTNYVCVDADPEFISNHASNVNGNMIYSVEGRCGALACPPYVDYRELACSVCSKIL